MSETVIEVVDDDAIAVVLVDDGEPGVLDLVDMDVDSLVVIEDDVDDLVIESSMGEPGASAYQEAVRLGFRGTEEEWVASLYADATELLENHIVAPEPHPAYDDIPDLTLLFENGLI